MIRRSLRTLPAIAAAAVLVSCSRGDGGAEPGAAGGLPIPADAAPGDARLMRLIDERVGLALARDRATWTVSSGPGRLREALTQAAHAARSPALESESGTVPALDSVAHEIDALALRLDDDLAPGSDLRTFAQQLQELLDGLVATAGTVVGDAGAVVEGVRRHLANALAVVEDVASARAALAQIASGVAPDSYLASAAGDGSAGPSDAWPDDGSVAALAVGPPASVGGGRRQGSPRPLVIEHEELPVVAEVLGLRPTSSNTVTLHFAVTNRGADSLPLDWGVFRRAVAGDVALVNLATGKRYPVLRDDAGNRMATSTVGARLAPGERRELWARYRVDPGATSVSVAIPGFPLVDDVPVGG